MAYSKLSFLALGGIGALAVSALLAGAAYSAAGAPKVITLTQVGCQFLESENGVNHGFKPKSGKDCEAINARTGKERLAKAKTLMLAPGKYIVRVTNTNVPYELGFWVRDKDYDWRNPIHQLTKISKSGGGLHLGQTQDYAVELKEGEYLYSCPLNPTPNYRLVVKG